MPRKQQSCSKIKKALVINDLHIPYQDPKCIELILKVLTHLGKETEVVLNGDVTEGASFSDKFTRPLEMIPWKEEKKQVHKFLHSLKNHKTYYLMGNHEERIRDHFANHSRDLGQAIIDEGGDVIIVAMGLKKFPNIKVLPSGEHLRLGSLRITHGEGRPSGIAGYYAKRYRETTGKSIMVGHSHRLGFSPMTYGGPSEQTIKGGWENGCLCRTTCWYRGGATSTNWQQGFSVVYYEDNPEGYFHVVQIPIIKHRFIFDGHLFEL